MVQVADRWHLLENASRAFLDMVRRSMSPIRRTLSAGQIKPALLTSAELIRNKGFFRRNKIIAEVQALATEGLPIRQIVGGPGAADKRSSGSPAENARTSSASGRVRSQHGCRNSSANGQTAVATALSSGGVFGLRALARTCAS